MDFFSCSLLNTSILFEKHEKKIPENPEYAEMRHGDVNLTFQWHHGLMSDQRAAFRFLSFPWAGTVMWDRVKTMEIPIWCARKLRPLPWCCRLSWCCRSSRSWRFYFTASGWGAQWLGGRVLDSRPKGRGFQPHRLHGIVVLEQDTFILILVQPRKTLPYITERLLMGCKEQKRNMALLFHHRWFVMYVVIAYVSVHFSHNVEYSHPR